ncbi:hypothetical protein [Flavobacterium oreochromis]|uniref:hypothetical protein n=1 Tax=Flavobacterium oreochromis TaxID=2906078 RepID=UPI000B4CCA96|nr:hypothetical protein [Flavobacterium oreochromis]OWP74376.1 hypothetical protein BWG23_14120 [Flavobacterium oreochromis]POR27933.1 hypothetical protein BWK58_03920 [Flavobacterium columnare]
MKRGEKYIPFYESVKQFVLDTKLTLVDEVEGLDETVIHQFEKEHQIEFPAALYAFLILFGTKIRVRKTEDYFDMTINDIKEAMSVGINENYKEIIIREKGFLDYDTGDDDFFYFKDIIDVNKLIFITQYHRWFSLGFIDSRSENPIIYHINEKEYYSTRGGVSFTFTSFIRDVLFLAINWRFDIESITDENIEKSSESEKESLIVIKNLIIDKLPWANFYVENVDIFYSSKCNYRKHRLNFYKIIEEQEKQTGYIMTVDEFEWAFIDYLKEQGVLNKIEE